MSLTIIIGKNKSGKSTYLENEYDNKKNDKVLFIPSEINLKEITTKEKVGS